MPITNISEAKAQLSALIRRVEEGEEVVIGRGGRPAVPSVGSSPSHQSTTWVYGDGEVDEGFAVEARLPDDDGPRAPAAAPP